MQRLVNIISSLAFVAFLLAPLALQLFLADSSVQLVGKTKERSKLDFTFSKIWSGKFQDSFEKWLRRRSNVRPYLVKTDNQISLSVFGQLSNNYNSKVVLGRQGHLIERTYLRSANKIRTVSEEKLKKKTRQLKNLQGLLDQHGVKLLLLISPNKPSLYPEFIPSGFRVPGVENRLSSYEKFIRQLDAHEVRYFDTRAFFEAKKRTAKYPFFAASGTHWDQYAACLVAAELLAHLESAVQKRLPNLSCDPFSVRSHPISADKDLLDLANVWFPGELIKPVPNPSDRVTMDRETLKPNLLFEGTSFLWALMRVLDKHKVYSQRDMYYYFKRKFSFPLRREVMIDKAKIDLKAELLKRDAVVIEINEAFPKYTGHGLIPAAIKALRDSNK